MVRFAPPQKGRAMVKAPASPGLARRPVGRPTGGIFPPPGKFPGMMPRAGGVDLSRPFPMPGQTPRMPAPPAPDDPVFTKPPADQGVGVIDRLQAGPPPSLPPGPPPPPPSLPPMPTRDVEMSLYDDSATLPPAPPPPPPTLPPIDGGIMGKIASRGGGIRKPKDDDEFTY